MSHSPRWSSRTVALLVGVLAVQPAVAQPTSSLPTTSASPDAFIGHWQSENRGFEVSIDDCGGALCATIVRDLTGPDAATQDVRPKVGWKILRDFHRSDGGEWLGEMHNFRNGKQYDCVMTLLSPDELLVRPYIGIRLISKRHVWHRVSDAGKQP